MTTSPRTPLWKSIATALEADLAAGHYPPGSKLPTEQELAQRFIVNRHTVRRALSDMADRGLVRSRRGSGIFVEAQSTEYPLGRRVRFHQNIQASGRLPQKKILRRETRLADASEREALHLSEAAKVFVVEGLSLSEDTPVALFQSVFPLDRLPGLPEAFETVTSITEALRRSGVADYIRAETRITAEHATATQAIHLAVREGDALLYTLSVNTDLNGTPVERGRTWFAGDRVALTLKDG
ncbi:phosphonate metabolism transcriptional regulator PhnF [Pseudoprimorskyibacter insulae]|uniref:Putative transcriptional regulator PhnF n=1 Tax=Pseudoprimorskyibacter insulae TaxID=1695997 RepID=A0A2R8AMY7_9RHOB|nr:phosphonate metabolism transcriptional regulator PhnF [Pseudoprimorskyibacter insulae]SPF77426.1 putative transcriptional regulator PhnF [Pseudoprimorskyibacter insulae]